MSYSGGSLLIVLTPVRRSIYNKSLEMIFHELDDISLLQFYRNINSVFLPCESVIRVNGHFAAQLSLFSHHFIARIVFTTVLLRVTFTAYYVYYVFFSRQ